MKKKYLNYLLLCVCNTIVYAQTSGIGKTVTLTYDDGIIAKNKWYNIEDKIDSLKTYYKTGELNESFYYDEKGKFHGLCTQQDKKGKQLTSWKFEHGKLKERIDHEKVYNSKNKEQRLKRYQIIEKSNQRLKDKFYFSAMISRAYARSFLGNSVLAERDFFIIKNRFEKYKENPKTAKYITAKKMASVYDVIASQYARYEDEDRAIHFKYLALKTNPTEGRLVYNLGGYLIMMKSYKLGIHYLNKVIQKAPKHPFANWALGIAHADLENYELALTHINTAYLNEKSINKLSIGTAERDLITMKGYLQHKLGDSELGIQNLNEALEINSDNSFAMRYLGEVYYDLENYEKACDLLTKATESGYEKKHDRDDLQYFIDQACFEVENNYVALKDLPSLAPNPVVNYTEVVNYPYQNFKFQIADYNSIIVLQGTADGTTINVSTLKPGLYILLLENGENPISIKLIKE